MLLDTYQETELGVIRIVCHVKMSIIEGNFFIPYSFFAVLETSRYRLDRSIKGWRIQYERYNRNSFTIGVRPIKIIYAMGKGTKFRSGLNLSKKLRVMEFQTIPHQVLVWFYYL